VFLVHSSMTNTHPERFSYLLFHKPYGVLSQFSSPHHPGSFSPHRTLKDFGPFPNGVYPVGRLDAESEGLLILTDDKEVSHRLTEPAFAHPRTYLVQVERIPAEDALDVLRRGGMRLGNRPTKPASVRLLEGDPVLSPRPVPIRRRLSVPTRWLEIILAEGMNRQVRRMTAAIGHPALRLIRVAVGPVRLANLRPGEWRLLASEEIGQLRKSLGLSPEASHRAAFSPSGFRSRRRDL
jgi:23S rRNA pseudouridine2457 synthase